MTDDLHVALSALTMLDYCIASETLGLGQCQCNSHPYVFRRDGKPLTEADIERFWSVVRFQSAADPQTGGNAKRVVGLT